MRPKLIHLRHIQKCKWQSTGKTVLNKGSPNILSSLYLSDDNRSWVSLMNDFSSWCHTFWFYKLQQKPPKHPKWSQPARSLHEPAGKLMYWTRGVQRSLGTKHHNHSATRWKCGTVKNMFFHGIPWLQSRRIGDRCFWDAHSWVARAIALLLPHQGTARPRTIRRLWLQRPEMIRRKLQFHTISTVVLIDPRTIKTQIGSKSWRVQNCRNSQTAWINAMHISVSCTRVARWLLPPIVASKSSRIW